jgi:hypothetical protein
MFWKKTAQNAVIDRILVKRVGEHLFQSQRIAAINWIVAGVAVTVGALGFGRFTA